MLIHSMEGNRMREEEGYVDFIRKIVWMFVFREHTTHENASIWDDK